MNWQNFKADIRKEEGWSGTAYQDSLGFWTIGYGFLVDSRKGDKLPMSVADAWLDYKLQEKIDKESIRKVRWYRKGPDTVEVPVPILGPDLIDPRRNEEIKAAAAAAQQEG